MLTQHKSCVYTLSMLGTEPIPISCFQYSSVQRYTLLQGKREGCALFFPPQHSYMPLQPLLSVGPFSFSTQILYSFDTLLHHTFHPVWSIIAMAAATYC